jgi:hypothetical protein
VANTNFYGPKENGIAPIVFMFIIGYRFISNPKTKVRASSAGLALLAFLQ